MTFCPKATFRDSLIKSSSNASRSSRVSSLLIRRRRRPPPGSSARYRRLLRLHPPLQLPTLVRERMNTSTVLSLPLRWLRACLVPMLNGDVLHPFAPHSCMMANSFSTATRSYSSRSVHFFHANEVTHSLISAEGRLAQSRLAFDGGSG